MRKQKGDSQLQKQNFCPEVLLLNQKKIDVIFTNGQVFFLCAHLLSPVALDMQPNFLVLKVPKSIKF
jgi:hypothetical protein